jgi:hypothetical protein
MGFFPNRPDFGESYTSALLAQLLPCRTFRMQQSDSRRNWQAIGRDALVP